MASVSSADNKTIEFTYPTTDDFDQNTAKRLLKECSTLIIEDIPIGTQIGIDLNVYNVGQKFVGMKMIASGLHFIHYSSVSKEGSVAPRTGFFRYFKNKELVVTKWNQLNEDIDDEYEDIEQIEKYANNLKSGALDQYLGAYQYSTYADWVGLTDYITESLFNRLNPKCGKIKAVTELIPISDENRKQSKQSVVDSEGLPFMRTEPNSAINFSEIPKRFVFPPNSSAAEISRHSMDASYTLESIVSKCEQMNDILGELQFSFITFLAGHVFDSFEYWRHLLKIVCMSEKAISEYPEFYLNFVRVLHFQLKQTPHDLFADIVENNNFLVTFLRIFFSNIILNPNVNQTLLKRAQRFQKFLTKNFKWDFSSELEEEAPTIVDP